MEPFSPMPSSYFRGMLAVSEVVFAPCRSDRDTTGSGYLTPRRIGSYSFRTANQGRRSTRSSTCAGNELLSVEYFRSSSSLSGEKAFSVCDHCSYHGDRPPLSKSMIAAAAASSMHPRGIMSVVYIVTLLIVFKWFSWFASRRTFSRCCRALPSGRPFTG